jgi:hypothetical protein
MCSTAVSHCGLDDLAVRVLFAAGTHVFFTASIQPVIQSVLETFSGIKRPEPEAGCSHQSSEEVNNPCSCTSTLPCVFMAWCFTNFTLTLPSLSPGRLSGSTFKGNASLGLKRAEAWGWHSPPCCSKLKCVEVYVHWWRHFCGLACRRFCC